MTSSSVIVIVTVFVIGAALTSAATHNTSATPTIATPTNATSATTGTDVVDRPHFKPDLRAIQQLSPQTNASGEAYFRILDD